MTLCFNVNIFTFFIFFLSQFKAFLLKVIMMISIKVVAWISLPLHQTCVSGKQKTCVLGVFSADGMGEAIRASEPVSTKIRTENAWFFFTQGASINYVTRGGRWNEVGVRAVRFIHFYSFQLTYHARTTFIDFARSVQFVWYMHVPRTDKNRPRYMHLPYLGYSYSYSYRGTCTYLGLF